MIRSFVFLSTHPRGVRRPAQPTVCDLCRSFYPRTREGCDCQMLCLALAPFCILWLDGFCYLLFYRIASATSDFSARTSFVMHDCLGFAQRVRALRALKDACRIKCDAH